MPPKTFLFLHRRPPYGSGHAREMFDAALIAASFDQQVHLAFVGDGVFQLLRDQQPAAIAQTGLTLEILEDADIEQVWVERESLLERGLAEADLSVPANVVSRAEMTDLLARMDMVLPA